MPLLFSVLFFTLSLNAQDKDIKDDKDKTWPNGFGADYQLLNSVGGANASCNNLKGFCADCVRKVWLVTFSKREFVMEYMMEGAQKKRNLIKNRLPGFACTVGFKIGIFCCFGSCYC